MIDEVWFEEGTDLFCDPCESTFFVQLDPKQSLNNIFFSILHALKRLKNASIFTTTASESTKKMPASTDNKLV